MTGLTQIYRPRGTPLHRVPAWLKIAVLAVACVAVTAIRDWRLSALACAGAALLLASTLPPPRPALRTLALFLGFALVGVGFHALLGDPATGARVGLTVTTLVLASLALAASTSSESLLALFSGLARPLRRWIPPEAVGLLASMAVRTVPETARLYSESLQAARARGLSRRPQAVLAPTAVRAVGYALALGEALTARGIADGPDAVRERPRGGNVRRHRPEVQP